MWHGGEAPPRKDASPPRQSPKPSTLKPKRLLHLSLKPLECSAKSGPPTSGPKTRPLPCFIANLVLKSKVCSIFPSLCVFRFFRFDCSFCVFLFFKHLSLFIFSLPPHCGTPKSIFHKNPNERSVWISFFFCSNTLLMESWVFGVPRT